MRKTIIMGVILSCFLLLVTPCISAVEYNEVKEEVKQQIETNIFNKLYKSSILNTILFIGAILTFIAVFFLELSFFFLDGHIDFDEFITALIVAIFNAIKFLLLPISIPLNIILDPIGFIQMLFELLAMLLGC